MADTLPAKRRESVVPLVFDGIEVVGPTHFDGWAADDVADLVVANASQVERREQETDAWRIGLGVGLWYLRCEVGEASYAGRLRSMADKTGVSVRTLNRWRAAAEAHLHLPATRRSIGQAETRQKSLGTRVPKVIPAASEPVQSPLAPAPSPKSERPSSGQVAHRACPSCRCPVTAAPRATTCDHPAVPPPLVKRNGRMCLICHKPWMVA